MRYIGGAGEAGRVDDYEIAPEDAHTVFGQPTELARSSGAHQRTTACTPNSNSAKQRSRTSSGGTTQTPTCKRAQSPAHAPKRQ